MSLAKSKPTDGSHLFINRLFVVIHELAFYPYLFDGYIQLLVYNFFKENL